MAGTAPRTRAGSPEGGVIYLMLLIAIAVLGAGLAATGSFWHSVRLREKERELLFVGLQYRRAIQRYYETPPAGRYPPTLEALLLDERSPAIRRFLRRPYRDPLTDTLEWGLVTAPQGGVMGIYSLAPGRPMKQANYPVVLNWEAARPSYADWQFVYVPVQRTTGISPQ